MMARITEVYAGRYLSGAELDGNKRRQAVIVAADVVPIGQGEKASEKVVLSLKNRAGTAWPRQLVLNKTNAGLLAAAFGDDTRAWPGCVFEIWAEPVPYQGKLVPGIKVKPLPSQGAAIVAPTLGGGIPPDEPDSASGLAADLDDEIPF